MKDPKDFTWGVATASYQIEGAARQDGKGPSIWDMFCKQPGRIKNGDTGDMACDHYHRYREDVGLMKDLAIQAYRFSVSWPRVIPDGTGKINQPGLDFYDRLTDCLLENHIEPWVTLYHWDLPHALFLKGGWLNRDIAQWFADYAAVVADKLSDRVSHWMTLNEPQCFINAGYHNGGHAPGLKCSTRDVLTVCHNVLLAHGQATARIRQVARSKSCIGVANTGSITMPYSSDPADVEAARTAMFDASYDIFIANFSWLCDPMILKSYPEAGLKYFAAWLPEFDAADMEIISQPIDFFGLNYYYSGPYWKACPDTGKPVAINHSAGHAQSALGMSITPEGMYWATKFMYERYRLPIVISENGMANVDFISTDGKVHDPQRIDFMERYIRQMKRAIADGVDIQAYFHWTLTDNFEWAEGYAARCGLVHMDFETLKRTPKDSACWYRDFILNDTIHRPKTHHA